MIKEKSNELLNKAYEDFCVGKMQAKACMTGLTGEEKSEIVAALNYLSNKGLVTIVVQASGFWMYELTAAGMDSVEGTSNSHINSLDDFQLGNKGEPYLVAQEVGGIVINNYSMQGNNFVSQGDMTIVDSKVMSEINSRPEIPEELKNELAELLIILKDKDVSVEEKNSKSGAFLAEVAKKFGDIVTGVVSGLVVAAMTGQM